MKKVIGSIAVSLLFACSSGSTNRDHDKEVGSYISGPVSGLNPAVITSTNTSTTVSAANGALNLQTANASGRQLFCFQNTSNSALACVGSDPSGDINTYYNNSTGNGVQFYDISGGGAGTLQIQMFNNTLELFGNSTFQTGGSLTLRPGAANTIALFLSSGAFQPTWAPLQTTGSPSVSGTQYTKPGTLRTVSSGTVTTIITVDGTAGFTNNSNALIEVSVACRAVTAPTAGAIGDGWMARRSIGARNVSNIATAIGSIASIETHTDTSMSTTACTITASGATMVVQMANVASATIDCTAVATITND
jgi:hypothetical protein